LLLKHTWAPGFLLAGGASLVLRDAADRGRLGASTFKRCELRAMGWFLLLFDSPASPLLALRVRLAWTMASWLPPCGIPPPPHPHEVAECDRALVKTSNLDPPSPLPHLDQFDVYPVRLNLGLAVTEAIYSAAYGTAILTGFAAGGAPAASNLAGSVGIAGFTLYQYLTAEKKK
jgi:hypothetical protein